jgi:hypothetical protein
MKLPPNVNCRPQFPADERSSHFPPSDFTIESTTCIQPTQDIPGLENTTHLRFASRLTWKGLIRRCRRNTSGESSQTNRIFHKRASDKYWGIDGLEGRGYSEISRTGLIYLSYIFARKDPWMKESLQHASPTLLFSLQTGVLGDIANISSYYNSRHVLRRASRLNFARKF